MRRLTIACVLLVVVAMRPLTAQEAAPTTRSSANDVESEAIEAVKKSVESYQQAFNLRDAKALTMHFAEQGELITPQGERLQGHAAIETYFSESFRSVAQHRLEIVDTRFESLSPNVILETGTARVVVAEMEPIDSIYRAVHVRTRDGWRLDSVREQDPPVLPPSHYERLKPLEWMVGSWVDTSDSLDVQLSCRWATNQNFLIQSFKAYRDDALEFEGTQIIGWDPSLQTIRSWTFDSDGGFAVGRWSNQGSRWTVTTLSVLPDGRRGSATHLYELQPAGNLEFQSLGRQIETEPLPSLGPLTLVRTNESRP